MNTFSHLPSPKKIGEKFLTLSLKEKMTLQNPICMEAEISADLITIVIPVKNNRDGVEHFLKTLMTNTDMSHYPLEVMVVDNNSDIPIFIAGKYPFDVQVLKCEKLGPGAARNVGVKAAKGKWILFTDSDCIATPTFISGYVKSNNDCVAYAGMVKVHGDDAYNNFYRKDNTLIPPSIVNRGEIYPWTLVTANCLVLKSAFDAIGGFNENFIYAGGEDTDLGIRLRMIGCIHYNFDAIAIHEFYDGFTGFVNRFIRYGRGHRLLNENYNGDLFGIDGDAIKTNLSASADEFLASVHQTSFEWGYIAEMLNESI